MQETQWPYSVSAQDSRSSGLSLRPGQSLYCVLGQNTLFSQCPSPPTVETGIGVLSGKPNEIQVGGGGGG